MGSRNKSIVVACLGHVYEHFVQKVFTFSGALLAGIFFPEDSSMMGRYGVYIAIACSSLLAPLGAFFLAWIGDIFGRRVALIYAYALGVFPTLFVAFLPTYEDIGLISSWGIIIARILQGISMGGVFGGSIILVSETSSNAARMMNMGLLVSLGFIGALAGTLSCSAVLMESAPKYLWRLPYILGAVLGIFLMRMRKDLYETEVWKAADKSKGIPLVHAIRQYRHNVVAVMCFGMSILVPFYIWLSWANGLLQDVVMPSSLLYRSSTVMLLSGILVVVSAFLAQHYTLKSLLKFTVVASMACLPLFYQSLVSKQPGLIFLSQCVCGIITGLSVTPVFLLIQSLFPPQYSYSGFSIPFLTGQALLMAPTPWFCEYLYQNTQRAESVLLLIPIALGIKWFAITTCKPIHDEEGSRSSS